jgi:hypothetical protein
MAEIIAVGSVNIANELKRVIDGGNVRQGGIIFQWVKRNMRESGIWFGSPIDDAPIDGVTEVFCDTFQFEVVNLIRGRGKLGEGGNCKAYVRASISDICVKQFTKKVAISEAHFFFQSGMSRFMFCMAWMLIKELDVAGWKWLRGAGARL